MVQQETTSKSIHHSQPDERRAFVLSALRVPRMELILIGLIVLAVVSLGILLSMIWARIYVDPGKVPMQADPLNVVDAFHSAVNDDDKNRILDLFTEDAMISDSGSLIRGRDEIQNWVLHSQRMDGLHLKMIHSQVTGEKIFWNDIANNRLEGSGKSYILRWVAVTQKDKIKTLSVSLVLMPDGK